jgi:hypothetical protein
VAFTLIDGVIANDAFATPATPGTSALVDGINNQQFATPASATAQPVDAVLGLSTWVEPAGGSISLTPGAGVLVFTGLAPTVSQTQSATPGVGSIAFTGFAPSILQPQALSPGAGALAFTGYAPSILQPRALVPDPGALSFTGYAPTIEQPQALSPDAGALAFTGYAPDVAQSTPGSFEGVPDAGVITFEGYAPDVFQSGAEVEVIRLAATQGGLTRLRRQQEHEEILRMVATLIACEVL